MFSSDFHGAVSYVDPRLGAFERLMFSQPRMLAPLARLPLGHFSLDGILIPGWIDFCSLREAITTMID